MSASRNDDGNQGASGEFHSSVPRSEPLTTHGHQPGQLNSEADRAPEFQAQTLPAGSAPADKTFQPNNISEVPSSGAYDSSETTAASDTIVGSDSGAVHTGLGKPHGGQTSSELRDNTNQRSGMDGVGASGAKHSTINERDPGAADQRGLERDDAPMGGKSVLGGDSANDQLNESA